MACVLRVLAGLLTGIADRAFKCVLPRADFEEPEVALLAHEFDLLPIHGGFAAGLGAIAVYLAFSFFTRRQIKPMLFTAVACGAATMANVYGLKFWTYLIPALLNKRPEFAEWQPLPLFANDVFLNFRILFALAPCPR